MNTPTATHYLVIDSEDNSVLAWFPMTESTAKAQAERLAQNTGHRVVTGYWNGKEWK